MSQFRSRGSHRPATQMWQLARDFCVVLAITTVSIAFLNVAAAQAVPVPIVSLIIPFDFGLTQTAIEAVHGGLTSGDMQRETARLAAQSGSGALAMSAAAILFAALFATTLSMYRRLKRVHAWRWSTHFE